MKTKQFNIEEWEKGTPAVFNNEVVTLLREGDTLTTNFHFYWFIDGTPKTFRTESGNGGELLLLDED